MPTKLQNEDKGTLTMSNERTRDGGGEQKELSYAQLALFTTNSQSLSGGREEPDLETNLRTLGPPTYSEQVQRKDSQVNQNKGR